MNETRYPLTPVQFHLFGFIKTYYKELGYMPSIEEMAKFRQRGTSSTWGVLRLIVEKGYIKKQYFGERSLVILDEPTALGIM